jgi:hypothetical protein
MAATNNNAPIFLGGAGRSGTTLLRVILDSHPNIACGPELKVTPQICQMWHTIQSSYMTALREQFLTDDDVARSFGSLILSLLEKNRLHENKRRVAEKSPNNVFFFSHLHRLFPGSPLVHVIRDGRDVVSSLLGMNWGDPVTGKPVEYTRDARKAASYWAHAVRAGRSAAAQTPSLAARYHELRYEQIVTSPVPTLQKLFAFLGEPWDPAVLRFHEKKRRLGDESSAAQVSAELNTNALGRWKKDLAPKDRLAVKEIAGDLLIELGYAANHDW